MQYIIGIDDAGRGPIIGPMVLAGVLIDKKDEPMLLEWGVKDSKQVPSEVREEIAKKIKEKFEHHIEFTSVEEIDQRSKVGTNLNRIEAIKASNIINSLLKNKNHKVKIVIDCPSTNLEAWKGYLQQYIEKKDQVELFIEHKADVNHVSCGAASIIAKVARDTAMETLTKEIGFDLGSGYPSDPVTSQALDDHLSLLIEKGIIRKTWGTFDKAIAKKEQKKLF